jgi:hypothetical protein
MPLTIAHRNVCSSIRIKAVYATHLMATVCALALGLCVSVSQVSAQTSGGLNSTSMPATTTPELLVKLQLERRGLVDGKETMLPTDRAAPGELMQYVASYSNQTHLLSSKEQNRERALSGVIATMPIPLAMNYLGNAKPIPNMASLDGIHFTAYPLTKTVKQTDGSTKQVPVDFAEYRALRWNLGDIAPKSMMKVVADVQVLNQAASASDSTSSVVTSNK